MQEEKIYLGSDNFAPVHPLILQAIEHANVGYARPYGDDAWTKQAQKLIQEVFKSTPKVLMLPSGTGANVLALKLACKRHESVICSDIAHIHYQESGAAESIVGCKLLLIAHKNGKITTQDILKRIEHECAFGKHSTSPRVVSIAQPTEVGTVYSLQELQELSNLCKEHKLLFHIDGSRLYNALIYLHSTFEEIHQVAQPDLFSLGGAKNGLLCAESLLIFNPALEEGTDYLHKQTLCLTSKMRYLSAQYIPFFQQNLWHTLALQANQRTQKIAALIESIPQLQICYPIQTNQIFFTAPKEWIVPIQNEIVCNLWNKEKNEIRFVTSWNTTEGDVQRVKQIFTKCVENTL